MPTKVAKDYFTKAEIDEILRRNVSLYKDDPEFVEYFTQLTMYLLDVHFGEDRLGSEQPPAPPPSRRSGEVNLPGPESLRVFLTPDPDAVPDTIRMVPAMPTTPLAPQPGSMPNPLSALTPVPSGQRPSSSQMPKSPVPIFDQPTPLASSLPQTPLQQRPVTPMPAPPQRQEPPLSGGLRPSGMMTPLPKNIQVQPPAATSNPQPPPPGGPPPHRQMPVTVPGSGGRSGVPPAPPVPVRPAAQQPPQPPGQQGPRFPAGPAPSVMRPPGRGSFPPAGGPTHMPPPQGPASPSPFQGGTNQPKPFAPQANPHGPPQGPGSRLSGSVPLPPRGAFGPPQGGPPPGATPPMRPPAPQQSGNTPIPGGQNFANTPIPGAGPYGNTPIPRGQSSAQVPRLPVNQSPPPPGANPIGPPPLSRPSGVFKLENSPLLTPIPEGNLERRAQGQPQGHSQIPPTPPGGSPNATPLPIEGAPGSIGRTKVYRVVRSYKSSSSMEIPCPMCSAQVSIDQKTCPGCGHMM